MSVLEAYEASVKGKEVLVDVDSKRLDNIEQRMKDTVRELFPSSFDEEVAPDDIIADNNEESLEDTFYSETTEISNSELEDKHESRFVRVKEALIRTAIIKPYLRVLEGAEYLNSRSRRAKAEKLDENESKWQRRRRRITRGVGTVAAAAAATGLVYAYTKTGGMHGTEYTMTPSTASLNNPTSGTDIMIGGHMDGQSRGIDAMYGGALKDNPNKVLIDYPAGMAPIPGGTATWNESIKAGAGNIVDEALASGNPGDVHIFGHSEGSTAAIEAANQLGDMGYDPELTITGSPDTGVSGFFYDPLAQAGKPLFDSLDIDTAPKDIPSGSTVYGKPGDFWANSGGRAPQTQAGQVLGTFFGGTHAYSPEELTNPANTSFVGDDGVEYVTVKDDLSGYGHAAQANGFAWSPQAENFVDSIAPEGEIGKPAPAIDMNKAIQTGTNLAVDSINQALPEGVPQLAEIPVVDTPPAPAPAPPPPPAPAPAAPAPPAPAPMPAPAPAPAPIPAPVSIPAPAEIAPQVNNTINDVAGQVQDVVGHNTPEAQIVDDIANQANDLVNSFLPR